MIKSESVDYHAYLPPYRSLLNPNCRYDYQSHTLVPLSANELNVLNLSSTKTFQSKNSTSTFTMKYKSLLSDVKSISKRISSQNILSQLTYNANLARTPSWPSIEFKNMPVEIVDRVFKFVDSKEDYKNCMLTCKLFYQLSKPYFYRDIQFSSSYRFAQFVTYLRVNSEVGLYVKSVNLSSIKPGNYEISQELETEEEYSVNLEDTFKILAGWRDWKFKSNPLYTVPSHPSTHCLTKTLSNSQSTVSSKKTSGSSRSAKIFSRSFKYFKHRKRSNSQPKRHPVSLVLNLNERKHSHPRISKFLLNYANSKDIPIGYLIHLINLCPNMDSLNMGNLSISVDYQVSPSMIQKYHTFDLLGNYPKDLVNLVDGIMQGSPISRTTDTLLQQDIKSPVHSSASSIYSLNFNKPGWKYNSLLPPVTDFSYLHKGDGKVFLSDLNVKSINTKNLRRVSEKEIIRAIKYKSSKHQFKYINLSSLVWLNKEIVQELLRNLSKSKFEEYSGYGSDLVELESDLETEWESHSQNLIVNLENSGMSRNLPWAKYIDMNNQWGCIMVAKILHNYLLDEDEERTRRHILLRGRVAENYFS